MIGYSSDTPVDIDTSIFTNSSGSNFTWNNAVKNKKLQGYAAYYDSSPTLPSQRKYKFSASSGLEMDDDQLKKQTGYWIYANQSGNLTLKSTGGAPTGATYLWSDLRFSNGSEERDITSAGTAGWIDQTLNYWGWNDGLACLNGMDISFFVLMVPL